MPNLRMPVCSVGLLLLMSASAVSGGVREFRFAGTLNQPNRAGDELVLRRFEVLLLEDPVGSFFSVLDDDRDGCPWPESFGRVDAANAPSPHLVYSYDGSTYTLPLPPLAVHFPDDVEIGTSWVEDGWTFDVVENGTASEGQRTWKIDASERRGRRQKLTVTADSGVLLKASQDVFMGQGERFELILNQTTVKSLADDASQQVEQLQSDLLTLQAALGRRPDTQLAELSPRQIADARSRIEALSVLAKGTPLQEAVLRISRDVVRQGRRVAETMKRQKELLDKSAPEFVLNLTSNGTLESDSLRGKTVILHFWKYSDKPLSEPYGQVGYLEFLFNQRQKMNVAVVGIAMNPLLQQNDKVASGKRSTRKLTEFMNLSYPIGYDDGSLLRALGDPRDSGGELPLWVVLSPTGKVVHYHSGFYEVDRKQGLKQLDDVVIGQIRAAAGE